MEDLVIRLTRQSLWIVLIISAPPLAVALVVGLVISVFQAVTQIQEQTLAYVPKIVAVFLILLILLPWIFSQITGFAEYVMTLIAQI